MIGSTKFDNTAKGLEKLNSWVAKHRVAGLELKVVMNQLESQMGIYSEAKLFRGQQQRLEYVTGKFRELQQYHPMFYHCNKDLIMNCLVALIRNIKLELWNYDDLYDQFY